MDYSLLKQLYDYHPTTYYHSIRVGQLCFYVSKFFDTDNEKAFLTMRAGLLHDIGKLSTPLAVLTKRDKLTVSERSIIMDHPQQGVQILKNLRYSTEIIEGVAGHHEREDGSGYPIGGNMHTDIARIVAVCDVFDAMVTGREYKREIPKDQAMSMMKDGQLGAFSPAFVYALDQVVTSDYLAKV